MGEAEVQLDDADGIGDNLIDTNPNNDFPAPFVRYGYLSDQVVHYKLIGENHSLKVDDSSSYSVEAN